ncbi:MAG TPA: hypothetical protein VG206_21230 [Terriglobia bacterium]|nr:hypothetical protein [Terriglobia bacterium]
MQKQVIGRDTKTVSEPAWLDLESEAAVEITSEDPARPIESALRLDGGTGWQAGEPGPQTIRIVFNQPQRISHVRLRFTEMKAERTQEFVLRWGKDRSGPLHDIARQQWNFSPQGSTVELEDYRVNLDGALILELKLNPDVTGAKAFASLDEFRVA